MKNTVNELLKKAEPSSLGAQLTANAINGVAPPQPEHMLAKIGERADLINSTIVMIDNRLGILLSRMAGSPESLNEVPDPSPSINLFTVGAQLKAALERLDSLSDKLHTLDGLL